MYGIVEYAVVVLGLESVFSNIETIWKNFMIIYHSIVTGLTYFGMNDYHDLHGYPYNSR